MYKILGKALFFAFTLGVSFLIQSEGAEASINASTSFPLPDFSFSSSSDHTSIAARIFEGAGFPKFQHLKLNWGIFSAIYMEPETPSDQFHIQSIDLFKSIRTFLFHTGLSPPFC